MHPKRPNQVKPHHLRRLAAVYIRVAALPGMDHSLTHERAQEQIARQWGWRKNAIAMIEADAGKPGTPGADRAGYRILLRLVKQGKFGLILATDVDRLTRSIPELKALLQLCRKTDTLVAIGGVILDPGNPAGSLRARPQPIRADQEPAIYLRQSQPPVGYTRAQQGSCVKDSNTSKTIEYICRESQQSRTVAEIANALCTTRLNSQSNGRVAENPKASRQAGTKRSEANEPAPDQTRIRRRPKRRK